MSEMLPLSGRRQRNERMFHFQSDFIIFFKLPLFFFVYYALKKNNKSMWRLFISLLLRHDYHLAVISLFRRTISLSQDMMTSRRLNISLVLP